MIFPRGLTALYILRRKEKKKKLKHNRFYRCVLYAYLQRLRARWKPGENINVKAGDGALSLPLWALADSRAGVSSLRRGAAGRQADERKQCARYHLHAGWRAARRHCRCKSICPTTTNQTSVPPPDGPLDVHTNKTKNVYQFSGSGSQTGLLLLFLVFFWRFPGA